MDQNAPETEAGTDVPTDPPTEDPAEDPSDVPAGAPAAGPAEDPSGDGAAFDPRNLHYDLQVDQPFCCFSGAGTTVIPLRLSVGKGAPLTLYDDSETQVTIGGQLFVNEGSPEEPQRGAQIGEFRANSGPFTAQKGRHYDRTMAVHVPDDAPSELLLDIDLVKENRFWGSSLGHRPATLVLTRRRVAIRPARHDPLDMTEALMQLHDARAREARYEAVIFSLLNHLQKRDG